MKVGLCMAAMAAVLFWAASALQSHDFLTPADVTPGRHAPGAIASPSTPAANVAAPGVGIEAQPALFRPAVSPVPIQHEPQPGEHFDLVGLVQIRGVAVAMLRDRVGGRIATASAGGLVANWRLTSVEGGCAILARGRLRQRVCE